MEKLTERVVDTITILAEGLSDQGQGRTLEALAIGRDALETDGGTVRSYLCLSRLHQRNGDFDKSVEMAERAVELGKGDDTTAEAAEAGHGKAVALAADALWKQAQQEHVDAVIRSRGDPILYEIIDHSKRNASKKKKTTKKKKKKQKEESKVVVGKKEPGPQQGSNQQENERNKTKEPTKADGITPNVGVAATITEAAEQPESKAKKGTPPPNDTEGVVIASSSPAVAAAAATTAAWKSQLRVALGEFHHCLKLPGLAPATRCMCLINRAEVEAKLQQKQTAIDTYTEVHSHALYSMATSRSLSLSPFIPV